MLKNCHGAASTSQLLQVSQILLPRHATPRHEQVREKIVENFRERMQLRRSLIELEDQNVQNSIEVKRERQKLHGWTLR